MKKVYINTIIENAEVNCGLACLQATIEENKKAIFNSSARSNIKALMKQLNKKGFHFFSSFCQFVFYFEYDPEQSTSIIFLDLSKTLDIDAALDKILELENFKGKAEARAKIKALWAVVQAEDKMNEAKMILRELSPHPSLIN